MEMEVKRLVDLPAFYKQKSPSKNDVIAGKTNKLWIKYSLDEYIMHSNAVSFGLLQLGIKPGDKVATITNNRPEWNFCDMGIMQIGAIHVPVYPTISVQDFEYIFEHAEIKVLFVADYSIFRKVAPVIKKSKTITNFYSFEKIKGVESFKEFTEFGNNHANIALVEENRSKIQADDIATIIYTSGTTGNPKGVMLTHTNILSNVYATKHIPPPHCRRALSFLPLSHVYERMLNYLYQYLGISIYYAESIGTIADDAKAIKPEIMVTVPRLIEKIFDKIMAKGNSLSGISKTIFFWAINLGMKYTEGGGPGAFYRLKLKIADSLVFKKWRAVLGGNLEIMVSGSSSLQPRLARIFSAAGIPVLEGYGLTETSPVLSVNYFGEENMTYGSVGPPLENVTIQIAEDGEILAKGPNVMKGYYKEPGLTAEAIDQEGWFHTGDLGKFNEKGHLVITGRKKELFKTSFGKYVAPAPLENKMKESQFIENIMVVGENQKFAGALIIPDFEYLKGWCKKNQLSRNSKEEMVAHQEVKKAIEQEVKTFNKSFGETEQIKAFELLTDEWTIDDGILTPTLKIKRDVVCKKYDDVLKKMFRIE